MKNKDNTLNKTISDIKLKYSQDGYSSLTEPEKIRLLLSYSEKGSKIIEISDNIIESYSNLHTLLDSDIPSILKDYNANIKTVTLFSLISDIIRIHIFSPCKNMTLNSIKNAKKYFSALLRKNKKEVVAVVAVNKNFRIIKSEIISHGDLTSVSISYRKVAELALATDAEYIFLSHCHPSASSSPSQEDINVTKRLKKALDLLDISLIDHIIVGRDGAYSMAEEFGTKIFTDVPKYKK